jgi:hypothetical protein
MTARRRKPLNCRIGAVGFASILTVLSSSGCSWLFVQPLPPNYERGDDSNCTTSRVAPVIDTIFTATNLASAIYVSGQNNVANKGSAAALGTSVAILWLSSAIYGYRSTSACEDALDDVRPSYSRPRLRLQAPPASGSPSVTFTAPWPRDSSPEPSPGEPSSGPPSAQAPRPGAPTPAVPAGADQQRDDDDPVPRPRRPPPAPRPDAPRFGD